MSKIFQLIFTDWHKLSVRMSRGGRKRKGIREEEE